MMDGCQVFQTDCRMLESLLRMIHLPKRPVDTEQKTDRNYSIDLYERSVEVDGQV